MATQRFSAGGQNCKAVLCVGLRLKWPEFTSQLCLLPDVGLGVLGSVLLNLSNLLHPLCVERPSSLHRHAYDVFYVARTYRPSNSRSLSQVPSVAFMRRHVQKSSVFGSKFTPPWIISSFPGGSALFLWKIKITRPL